MAPLPSVQQRLKKPLMPFIPSQDENGDPTTCIACGQLAFGVGCGLKNDRGKMIDPGFTCKPCIVASGDISKLQRSSVYEVQALKEAVASADEWRNFSGLNHPTCLDDLPAITAGVDAAGEKLAEFKETDLALFTEEQRNAFVRAIWAACAAAQTGNVLGDDYDKLMHAKATIEGFARGVRSALREVPF